jgi:hypothetical protein
MIEWRQCEPEGHSPSRLSHVKLVLRRNSEMHCQGRRLQDSSINIPYRFVGISRANSKNKMTRHHP